MYCVRSHRSGSAAAVDESAKPSAAAKSEEVVRMRCLASGNAVESETDRNDAVAYLRHPVLFARLLESPLA